MGLIETHKCDNRPPTTDNRQPTTDLFHMGFFYRKSINFGPFRVNLSKSGVGYSVGGKGFRVGTSARGRRYSAFSIPGTGVGYRGSGCLILLAAIPASLAFTHWIVTSLS